MKQYNVTGMSCAACVARVEKAVKAVEGVESCTVSLLTNSMGVEGSASAQEIIAAVENAGYGAQQKNGGRSGNGSNENNTGNENTGNDDKKKEKNDYHRNSIACCCYIYNNINSVVFKYRYV